MIKHNQDGAVNALLVSLILAIVFLIAAVSFAGWAYTERQDYKNNSDAKARVAAIEAKKAESTRKDLIFAEEVKKPFKVYNGPAAYGSVVVTYPKTWSAYVDDTAAGGNLLDAYFNPDVVPSATHQNSVFALRVQVSSQTYAQTLQTLSGQQQSGKLTVSAYALPKLPKVVGVIATGEIITGKSVTMVILPLRSQTLKLWTDGNQNLEDFNKNILPNFSFSP